MSDHSEEGHSDSEGEGSDDDLNLEDLSDDESESDTEDLEGGDLEDDDEDEEESDLAEAGTKPKGKKSAKAQLKREISAHKQELQELKARDPEFFKFLEQNDQSLLEFGDENADEDAMEVEDEEEEVEYDDGIPTVTREMIASWRASMVNTKSLKATRRALMAFRAASAMGDAGEDDQETYSYKVEEGAMFNNLILLCMRHVPNVFNHHAYGPAAMNEDGTMPAVQRKGLPSNSKKWKKLQPLVKSFLSSLLRILKSMTDVTVLKFVLRESDGFAPYVACFPKQGKDYFRQLLKFWTGSNEHIRIVAFLCIRRLAVAAPNPYLDMALKGTYRAYADQSRNTTIHTWTHILFMANCIVELGGIHIPTTYQHAFVSIRQLAMHLRSAISTKTKESFKAVYNWQYLHALRLWTRLLVTYCDPTTPLATRTHGTGSGDGVGGDALRPLIYPLVQVTIGALRLKPSAKYFPYRFHCVQHLIDLARHAQTFIPCAAHLFDVLDSAECRSKPKPSTLKPLDFSLNFKTPNQYVGTRVYQTGLVEQVVELLFEYYDSLCLSIAFPEVAVPAIVQLKRYVKRGKNMAVAKQVGQLIEKLEQNSTFITAQRSNIEFAPTSTSAAASFLSHLSPSNTPLGKYVGSRRAVKARELERLRKEADQGTFGGKGRKTPRADPITADSSDEGESTPKAKKGAKVAQEEDEEEDEVEDYSMSGGEDDEEEDGLESGEELYDMGEVSSEED
ncbi:Noc2p family-domain-containing protein [Phlyctochytrium arcticum]|nr:Noc2p family-domain-containing protein [Phlyctochytrium arcticum]